MFRRIIDRIIKKRIEKEMNEYVYSKAFDIVWDILKDETLHLIKLAKEDAYAEGERKSKEGYEAKLQDLIKQSTDIINIPLFLLKKEEARIEYLKANKIKDITKEQFFLGQIKLIEEITNKQ